LIDAFTHEHRKQTVLQTNVEEQAQVMQDKLVDRVLEVSHRNDVNVEDTALQKPSSRQVPQFENEAARYV